MVPSTAEQGPGEFPNSNQQLFTLLDNLLDPSVVVDNQGKILFVSKAFTSLLGYSLEDLFSKDFRTILSSVRENKVIRGYFKDGNPKKLGKVQEVLIQHEGGHSLKVRLLLTQHKDFNNRNNMYSVVLRLVEEENVNMNHRAFLELERAVVDNLGVPAIIMNEEGMIEGFNKASEKLFGYSLVEIVGKSVELLMTCPCQESESFQDYLKALLNDPERSKNLGVNQYVIAMQKDGTMMPVYLSLTAKNTESGHIFTGIIQTFESDSKLTNA